MRPGSLISGRYEVERLAGAGGMGTVYRARDRVTQQWVAVKLALRGDARGGGAGGARFAREARALAALAHPGIVRCLDSGTTEDGELYLVTEWVDGVTLSARLGRGAFTEAETIQIGLALADALAAAHARGIVHRDVKPANVMLTGGDGWSPEAARAPRAAITDRVKLIDFGLAWAEGLTQITAPGAVMGTPGYMSPEQASGGAAVDARADLYSLGATLFACLTGRPPYAAGHPVAVLAKLLFEVPPRVRDLVPAVSAGLDELICQLLARRPEARPVTAGEVSARLAALADATAESGAQTAAGANGAGERVSAAEQRFVSVLLISDPARQARSHELAHRLARLGADARPLRDGTLAAVLSAESSPGDMVTRAARCALQVHAEQPGLSLSIATGRVMVGQHGPIGEVIDRAAGALVGYDGTLDLDTPCPPDPALAGEIRVDDVTARLIETRFAVERAPGSGHVLRAELTRPRPVRAVLGRAIPCVGRDREIDALEALYDAAAGEGGNEPAARAVLVMGEAGIGKSRVLHEVLDRLRGRGAGRSRADESPDGATRSLMAGGLPSIWQAHGDPVRAGSPLGVLGQIVRHALGLEDVAAGARVARLRARADAVVEPGDAARVAAFLGEIAGVRLPDSELPLLAEVRRSPQSMHDQMLLAWLDFAAAAVRGGPVVIAVEDLHWADRPSIEFLDAALREASARPLLVVATARPEVSRTHPELWRQRGLEQIALRPLPARACRAIVETVLPGAEPALVGQLAGKCEGNPFFLEEIVRAADEARRAGAVTRAGDVPDTVLALVSARLDQLSPEQRRALRAASVFGGAFWLGGVAGLLGVDAGAVEGLLTGLIDRELVARRSRSRLDGEAEYGFRHDLLREAAYASLTDADRERAHREAGAWLERAGETDAAALAGHFERGRAPEQALPWLHRAAGLALEANDLAAVVDLVERAVTCGARHEVLGELRLLQAEAENWLSRHHDAGTHAAEAMELLPTGTVVWAHAGHQAAFAATGTGNAARVESVVRALVEHAPDPLDASYAVAIAHCGGCFFQLGRIADAAGLLAHASQAVPDHSPSLAAAICDLRVGLHLFEGRVFSTLQAIRESAERWKAAGNLRHSIHRRAGMGDLLKMLGAYQEATSLLREVVTSASRIGASFVLAPCSTNLIFALAGMGDLAAARAELAGPHLETEHHVQIAMNHLASAVVALMEGSPAALAESQQAVMHAARSNDPATLATARALHAKVLLAFGRASEALDVTRAGMATLAAGVRMQEGEALLRLCHAEALLATGHTDEARHVIADAEAWLLAYASDIKDDHLRASFLGNVEENRRILELARAWRKPDEVSS